MTEWKRRMWMTTLIYFERPASAAVEEQLQYTKHNWAIGDHLCTFEVSCSFVLAVLVT